MSEFAALDRHNLAHAAGPRHVWIGRQAQAAT
jgi:hypothetical protein